MKNLIREHRQSSGRAAEQIFREQGLRDMKHLRSEDEDPHAAPRGIGWGVGVGILLWAVLMILFVNQFAAGS